MIQFANTSMWWALVGLAIPIGIHLLSRKEGKVIRLGSLRHLQETSTQQFKGFRLNEIALLIARCALIILFSLILLGLQFTRKGGTPWLVIEKGLERIDAVKEVVDSLDRAGYEAHWLSDQFPDLADSASIAQPINYWRLAGELHKRNFPDAIVIAGNSAVNFRGQRVGLDPRIRWIAYPAETHDYALRAVQTGADSISVRTGHTGGAGTSFTTQSVSSLPESTNIKAVNTVHIALISDPEHAYDRKIFMAALMAIRKSFPINLEIQESTPDQPSVASADWCVWLAGNQPRAPAVSKRIVLHPQPSPELIIQSGMNEWTLTQPLNEGASLNSNMTARLALLIIPEKASADSLAAAMDRRTLPDSVAWRSEAGSETLAESQLIPDSADPYLLVLLLLVLAVERFMAYQRNQ